MTHWYSSIPEPIPEGGDWWRSVRYFPKTIRQQDFGYPIPDSDLEAPWRPGTAPLRRTDESFLKTGSSTVQFGRDNLEAGSSVQSGPEGAAPQLALDGSVLKPGSSVASGHEGAAPQLILDGSVLKPGSSVQPGPEGAAPQLTLDGSVLKPGSSVASGHEGAAPQLILDGSVLKPGSSVASGHEGAAPQLALDGSVSKPGLSVASGHEGTAPQPRKDEASSQSSSTETGEGTFVIISSSSRYQDLKAKVVEDFVVVSGQYRHIEKDGSVVISAFTRRYMLPKECLGEQAKIRSDSDQVYIEVKMNMPITY